MQTLARAFPAEEARQLTPLLKDWITQEIEYLRGGPDRSYEWVAALLEETRFKDDGLVSATEFLLKIRDALLLFAVRRGTGLEGEWLYEQVLRLLDRHMVNAARHAAQRERDGNSAQRRTQRQILEALEEPFVLLDNDGIIRLTNSAFAKCCSQSMSAVEKKELAHALDEATTQELRKALRQKRGASARRFGGAIVDAQKRQVPANFYIQPIFDSNGLRDGFAVGVQLLNVHAPERFLAQTLDQALRFVPISLQVFDANSRVIFSSGTCCGVLQETETASRPLCCTLVPRDKDQACVCATVFNSGVPQERDAALSRAEYLRWLRLLLVPIRDNNANITHVSCLAMDVSQRRGLEHQILEHQRSSPVAQVALSVAHQLRNPLGVMVGFAEMLSRGLPPQEVPQAVERILGSGLRCKKIVEELLEFGQSSPADRSVISVERLIAEQVQPMFPSAQKARIDWITAASEACLECVPMQFAQVLVSLLDNALQAGERVKVTVDKTEDIVFIAVEDDGPGIPEEFHQLIFEPFFTTRKESGAVGLGLSLSRAVVSEYGGKLYLDEKSRWSRFVVEMPAATMDSTPAIPASQATKPKVLVVDDELDLLSMLETALRLRNVEVQTASTGDDAIALLQSANYSAAVLDVQLPGEVNGATLFRAIQQKQPELARRTLFITADTMNFQTRQFLDQTQRPVLEKPFLVTDFLAQLDTVLAAN